jgi:hexulose-6-phosphate isomerase
MIKSVTLRAFPPDMDMLDRCRLAARAGFQAVELNLESGGFPGPKSSEAELLAFGASVRDLGLAFSSIYSREQWRTLISSADPVQRQQGHDLILRLIEVAQLLDIGAVLVIPGAVDDSLFGKAPELIPYDVAWERVSEELARLLPIAQQAGVTLAIENVPSKFLVSPLEMARFVDELNHPSLGVYFDVANAMLYGIPEHWVRILGRRIARLHVKDYRQDVGGLRGFCGLLQGDIDWPAVVAALQFIGYDGFITSEVLPAYHYHNDRLIYDTSAAISTIFEL